MSLVKMYEKISGLIALELFDAADIKKDIDKEFGGELLNLRNLTVDDVSKYSKEELFDTLRIYDVYFRAGDPLISDELYDEFYTFYEEPNQDPIMFETSVNAWKKVPHDIVMGSLDKCNNIDEVEAWNARKEVQPVEKVISEKLDGISCIHKGTIIETDQGPMSIEQIVDNRLNVSVKSFNHEKNIVEYKKVIAHQALENDTNKKWLKVKAKNKNGEIVELITTSDHYWYSPNEKRYKPIEKFSIRDKIIYTS